MTPKEKAETLIHKYRMLLMNDGEHNSSKFDEELEEFINDYGYSIDEIIYKVFNLKTEQYV